MTRTNLLTFSALAAVTCISALPAAAQDGQFALELNNARSAETGCRLTYVAQNTTGMDLSDTAFEVAVFDKDGTVDRMLILEFGALQDGKTKVLQFDLAGQPCDGISRLLVNGAAECTASDGDEPDCLTFLEPSSRTDIAFDH